MVTSEKAAPSPPPMTMQGPSTVGLGPSCLCTASGSSAPRNVGSGPLGMWKGPGGGDRSLTRKALSSCSSLRGDLSGPCMPVSGSVWSSVGGRLCNLQHSSWPFGGFGAPDLPARMLFLLGRSWDNSGGPQGAGYLTREPVRTSHPTPTPTKHNMPITKRAGSL